MGHFHGHAHAGQKGHQMTYFCTPGPPQAKSKGGPGYEATHASKHHDNDFDMHPMFSTPSECSRD